MGYKVGDRVRFLAPAFLKGVEAGVVNVLDDYIVVRHEQYQDCPGTSLWFTDQLLVSGTISEQIEPVAPPAPTHYALGQRVQMSTGHIGTIKQLHDHFIVVALDEPEDVYGEDRTYRAFFCPRVDFSIGIFDSRTMTVLS